MERKVYTINAEGQVLGRLASRVAELLRGKRRVDFMPHIDSGGRVVVYNTDKIKVTGRKVEQKIYWHHTGYIGHLKLTPFKKLFAQDSREVLKRAVVGMVPKNRTRAKIIKRLHMWKGELQKKQEV